MGIYIFNTKFLFEQLIKDADMPGSSRDFGKDIIPSVIENYRVLRLPIPRRAKRCPILLARCGRGRQLLVGEYGTRQCQS